MRSISRTQSPRRIFQNIYNIVQAKGLLFFECESNIVPDPLWKFSLMKMKRNLWFFAKRWLILNPLNLLNTERFQNMNSSKLKLLVIDTWFFTVASHNQGNQIAILSIWEIDDVIQIAKILYILDDVIVCKTYSKSFLQSTSSIFSKTLSISHMLYVNHFRWILEI